MAWIVTTRPYLAHAVRMLYDQQMEKNSKTLLDLIQEFAALNESKTLSNGLLSRKGEARWSELRDFYETLMVQNGLCPDPASRFSTDEIRETVVNRGRLRVRTDLATVVELDTDLHHARVGNLSCGGVLLLSDEGFDQGMLVTLHLADLSQGDTVIPAEGQVVWGSDRGTSSSMYRFRMGIQFLGLEASEHESLDSFVVDSLEKKLLSLARDALDADFIRKENISI